MQSCRRFGCEEVVNRDGARYPTRTFYCTVLDLNRHLSQVRGTEAFNILNKNDRR